MFSTPSPGFFRRGSQANTGRQSSGRRPETTVNETDRQYFSKVSTHYKELVGIETLPATETPAGAFFEYGYYQFGVPSFSTPGWAPVAPADTSEGKKKSDKDSSVDLALLQWMDAVSYDGFVPWEAYDHPTLGEVEIGGFRPYEVLNPPRNMIDSLGPKHGAFAVELASLFARVQIARTEVQDHGGGIFRIKAEVENAGFLPTATAHGVTSRSVKPTMVQLDVEPDALLVR